MRLFDQIMCRIGSVGERNQFGYRSVQISRTMPSATVSLIYEDMHEPSLVLYMYTRAESRPVHVCTLCTSTRNKDAPKACALGFSCKLSIFLSSEEIPSNNLLVRTSEQVS